MQCTTSYYYLIVWPNNFPTNGGCGTIDGHYISLTSRRGTKVNFPLIFQMILFKDLKRFITLKPDLEQVQPSGRQLLKPEYAHMII